MKPIDLDGATANALHDRLHALTDADVPCCVGWRGSSYVFRTKTEARWFAIGVQDGRAYEADTKPASDKRRAIVRVVNAIEDVAKARDADDRWPSRAELIAALEALL